MRDDNWVRCCLLALFIYLFFACIILCIYSLIKRGGSSWLPPLLLIKKKRCVCEINFARRATSQGLQLFEGFENFGKMLVVLCERGGKNLPDFMIRVRSL